MSKTVKIVIILVSIVLVLGILTGTGLGLMNMQPKRGEVEDLGTVGDGKSLKVGVLSDTQLPQESDVKDGVSPYKENLKETLALFKEQKVDMILHAGDICENATDYAYQTYVSVFEEIYPDEKSRPITQYIMGNHDFWGTKTHQYPGYKKNLFKKNMKVSPWTHYVVNGFHFIAASPDTGNSVMGYEWDTPSWMKEQIEIAEKDAREKGQPVFVMTHANPRNTVYGSDSWGDPYVNGAMEDYSNVVSISGHSHYSILDERSIFQDQYTAFSTQSVAYVEMETNKFDAFKGKRASCPPNDTDCPMAIIMNVTQEDTQIQRWNVKEKKEEKQGQRWTLSYPLETGNFKYGTEQRTMARTAPAFPANAAIRFNPSISNYQDKEPKTLPGLTFTAAQHPDMVHSYYIQLTNQQTGQTYQYRSFTDFYAGVADMKETVDLALDPALPTGKYRAKVYGVESFGKVSEKPLEISFDWTQVPVDENS